MVGNFLRDGESNYLEGALLIIVYIIVAIACWVSHLFELSNSVVVTFADLCSISPTLHFMLQELLLVKEVATNDHASIPAQEMIMIRMAFWFEFVSVAGYLLRRPPVVYSLMKECNEWACLLVRFL